MDNALEALSEAVLAVSTAEAACDLAVLALPSAVVTLFRSVESIELKVTLPVRSIWFAIAVSALDVYVTEEAVEPSSTIHENLSAVCSAVVFVSVRIVSSPSIRVVRLVIDYVCPLTVSEIVFT